MHLFQVTGKKDRLVRLVWLAYSCMYTHNSCWVPETKLQTPYRIMLTNLTIYEWVNITLILRQGAYMSYDKGRTASCRVHQAESKGSAYHPASYSSYPPTLLCLCTKQIIKVKLRNTQNETADWVQCLLTFYAYSFEFESIACAG